MTAGDGKPRFAHERQPMLSEKAPKDTANLVYFIALLNGIGVLMPWNMFITIAPQYYVDYWFSQNGTQTEFAKSFMSTLGVASQLPNVTMNLINIFIVIGGSLLLRIVGPLLVNCVSIMAVIVMIVTILPSIGAMSWFYTATLCIVATINMANGLYQNSIFGLFADFPANYTNAIVLGNNFCGTIITVINIVCTLLLNDVRSIAMIYFSISLCVLLVCLASMIMLRRMNFFIYYVEMGAAHREAENSGKPSFAQYVETFKKGWVQFYNVFFVFFITLTIFPAMLTATPLKMDGEEWTSIWPKNTFVSITTFLNFNVFATVGSFLAGFVQFPSPRYLWIVVSLRALFLPFFLFCNYVPDERTLPVIFSGEWSFTGGVALMALTSGYFSSLAMMYAPRSVPKSLSKISGMVAALFLILGIFAGVSFTFVCRQLASNF